MRELKHLMLSLAPRHIVADKAPETIGDLAATSLIIWSGASENTIWHDPCVNWAFRAHHDSLHLKSGLGFTIQDEIALGRIAANEASRISLPLADLIYAETVGQVEYYATHGHFPIDQKTFTLNYLKQRGVIL